MWYFAVNILKYSENQVSITVISSKWFKRKATKEENSIYIYRKKHEFGHKFTGKDLFLNAVYLITGVLVRWGTCIAFENR